MLCGATQDGWIMVERSDRMWSTGEGNGKPLQYSCLENPWTVGKGKIIGYWMRNSLGQLVSIMLLEISGEITPERKRGWSQRKNNTQLWMWLVIEARSDAVRGILHRNLECQVHESRQIGSGQTRDGKGERWHSKTSKYIKWNSYLFIVSN